MKKYGNIFLSQRVPPARAKHFSKMNLQLWRVLSSKQGDKPLKMLYKLTKTMNKIHNVDKADIWFYNLSIL